jgi:hemolysin activation/secretion protein
MGIIDRKLLVMMLCAPIISWAAGGSESMDRPSMRPLLTPPAKEKITPNFNLPLLPKSLPHDTQEEKPLFIDRIEFEGNTVIDSLALHEVVKSHEGHYVGMADLEEMRLQLSHYYIDHGYLNSGALLDMKNFQKGVLRFTIVEGQVEEVVVHGQEGLREGYIANRLRVDEGEPLNLQVLQDRFQLLLSDPLISRMNGRILPGSSLGKSILDVEVARARPYQLSFLGNNQRPPSVGSEGFGVNGWVKNLTSLGETTEFTYYNSAGSNRYSGGITVPITDQDTQAFFHFDEGDSSVQEQPISKIHVTSQVHSLEGGLSHPFINTSKQRFNFGTLIALRENQTYIEGQPFSFTSGNADGHTQATVFRAFQDYIQRWESQAISLRSTFSVGIDALGATIVKNQSNAQDSEFFSWLGQAQYAYRVDDSGSQFILRGNSQLTNDSLLPLERMAIGGMGTVRGYRENQLVRDNGYDVTAEFHYPVLDAATVAETEIHLNLVPFIDYGSAWNKNEKEESLFSIGSGFELDWKQFHSEFYYGYALNAPTQKQQGDLQDMGIHFRARVDTF